MRSLSRRHAMLGLSQVLLAPALAGCQLSPGTGESHFNFMSADEEADIGRKTHPQIVQHFGGAYDNPALQAYVAGLGQRLGQVTETPAADFRFTVLNSDIVNAMAVPGGYVYVTRGLLALAANEAELAGVIGHELGHILARHSAQRYSRAVASNVAATILGAVVGMPGVADLAQMGAGAWLQAYSRENEFEADSLGVRYMSRSGWNANAMVSMLGSLRSHARLEARMAGRDPDQVDQSHFMSTHPRTTDRVQAAIDAALKAPPSGTLGADTLLDRVDGMVFGDDPSQGFVRDRVFVHPGEGFRFEVPAGFRITNGERAVQAQHPNGAAILFDGAKAPAGDFDMLGYLTHSWLPKARLAGAERIQVNGMAGATATTTGRTRQGNVDVRVVAVRFDSDSIYRFTFLTPPRQTTALGEELRRATYSLRPLSTEERREVQPWRIKVVRVKAGDSVASLSARMALAQWKEETFRLLNRLDEDDRIEPGRRVKLVV
ncbi:M48 family metalloprotease [Magnetospirillum moscoviense]|nr:M48 family metalloprotease [Magnetospirillum moscoviense]